jgi:hypothetical protein
VLSSSFVSFARCVNLWVVHNFQDSKLVFLPFLIDYICCFTVQKAIYLETSFLVLLINKGDVTHKARRD